MRRPWAARLTHSQKTRPQTLFGDALSRNSVSAGETEFRGKAFPNRSLGTRNRVERLLCHGCVSQPFQGVKGFPLLSYFCYLTTLVGESVTIRRVDR
jgi:hypothetical protein